MATGGDEARMKCKISRWLRERSVLLAHLCMGPSAGSRRGKGGEKSKVPYRSDGVAGRVRHAFGGPDRGAKQSVARAWRRCLFYPTCSQLCSYDIL